MNNKLLTVAAITLLLAGQTAFAGSSEDGQEFLNWLDNAGQENVQQVDQSNDFSTISIKETDNVDPSYKPEEDIFSIHYMSNN